MMWPRPGDGLLCHWVIIIIYLKVAHPESPETHQRVPGGTQPLPDWLRVGETVRAEPQHTQPEPATSMLGTASASLSQPVGELLWSYSYGDVRSVLKVEGLSSTQPAC